MRFINPKVHAYIDYAIVLMFVLGPTLFGFGGLPATLAYTLAGVHLTMSLLTDYPVSLAKIIPFSVHGAIEFVVAVALLAIPWVLDFDALVTARNFFLGAGITTGLVWLSTEYRMGEETAGIGAGSTRAVYR